MRMDGDVINTGDKVYDVLFATGTVTAVVEGAGSFRVAFTDGRTHTYTADGKRARVAARTLYWKDPVVVVPQKSDAQWDMLPPIIRAVASAIRARVN
jgi:hypothetical protein